MVNVIQDLFFVVVLMISVVGVIREGEKEEDGEVIKKYGKYVWLIIILVSIANFIFRLSKVPQGLHVDEAGAMYDAICLSQYGVDRYLYKMPIYLINFGGGQSALYAYLAGIMMKILGVSTTVFRLPAVILSLISMICFYQMLTEHFGKKQGLFGIFLLAIVPWNIMKSRWGLDCNLMSSMMLISIFLLCHAIRSNKIGLYLISGVFWGLTLYTYVISYLVIPIFLGSVLLYGCVLKKINLKEIVFFIVPLGLLAIPLLFMILQNSGYLSNISLPGVSIPQLWFFRGGEIALANVPENIRNIFEIIFIKDFLNYNAIPIFGTLYKMSIPLVIFGVIESIPHIGRSIKQKEFNLDAVMMIAWIVEFTIGLCIVELNINKINAIYIPLIYFAARFLCSLASQGKRLGGITVVCLYMISFIMFEQYYFTDFANTNLTFFEQEIIEISQQAEGLQKPRIYIENCIKQIYIYTLIATPISPDEFQENLKIENGMVTEYGKYQFRIPQKIDENAVYIIKNDEVKKNELVAYGFQEERNGEFSLFYFE